MQQKVHYRTLLIGLAGAFRAVSGTFAALLLDGHRASDSTPTPAQVDWGPPATSPIYIHPEKSRFGLRNSALCRVVLGPYTGRGALFLKGLSDVD